MDLRKALTIVGRGFEVSGTRLGSIAESLASDDPPHPATKPGGEAKSANGSLPAGVMDALEAERSNNANLAILQTTRGMLTRAISMLR